VVPERQRAGPSGMFGRTPRVPELAGQLDPGIAQLHSSAYKNSAQLQPGRALVVGASHSGGDIAYEAGMAGHPTVLSGRIHGEVPSTVVWSTGFRQDFCWIDLPVIGDDGWPLESRRQALCARRPPTVAPTRR
jgi:hypothetical protein